MRIPLTSSLAIAFVALLAGRLPAQLEPPGTGGVVALDHELRMLGHYRRVLMIGAHPDDEDTELLTVLVARTEPVCLLTEFGVGEGLE